MFSHPLGIMESRAEVSCQCTIGSFPIVLEAVCFAMALKIRLEEKGLV